MCNIACAVQSIQLVHGTRSYGGNGRNKFGGFSITDLRYPDDAVLVADKKKKLQKMIDKLNETCKEYGMDINVRKTKVIVVGGDRVENGSQACFTLNGVQLEQVTRFKYLGSWISEDARCV